jgi:hypothetical protein
VDSAFSNGLIERLNQTLVNRIRCAKNDPKLNGFPWTTLASQRVDQYNSTPHSVTSFAPGYLLTGSSLSIIPKAFSHTSDLSADRKVAFQKSVINHKYSKSLYDKRVNVSNFSVGDTVYIENGSKHNRNKLNPVRLGPFKITRKLSDSVFEVDVHKGNFRKRIYHVSKMIRTEL